MNDERCEELHRKLGSRFPRKTYDLEPVADFPEDLTGYEFLGGGFVDGEKGHGVKQAWKASDGTVYDQIIWAAGGIDVWKRVPLGGGAT